VYWKRLLFRSGLALLLLMALLVLLLPTALRIALGEWLQRQGAEEALIENIDLNPLTGRMAIEGVHLRFPGARPFTLGRLTADLDIVELTGGRIVIDQLRLDGLRADIRRDDKGNLYINGWSPQPLTSKPNATGRSSSPPSFALALVQLSNLQIRYSEPEFSQPVLLRELSFGPLRSRQPEQASSLAFDLQLRSPARLQGRLKLTPLATSPGMSGTLHLSSLELGDYTAFFRNTLEHLSGRLSMEVNLDLSLPQGDPRKLKGQLIPHLRLSNLNLRYRSIEQRVGTLDGQGKVRLDGLQQAGLTGQIQLEQGRTRDPDQQQELASFNALKIDGIEMDSDAGIRIASLCIDRLRLLPDPKQPPLLDLDGLRIEHFERADGKTLSIGDIRLAAPKLRLVIDEQGQLPAVARLQTTVDNLAAGGDGDGDTGKAGTPTTAAPSDDLRIDRLRITKPGRIDFSDRSVTPNFKTRLTVEHLEIDALSRTEPARFSAQIRQGEYNRIEIDGQGLLLNPRKRLTLKADIEQLDLPPLTPYSSKILGYGVRSGALDSQIDLTIEASRLDALIKLDLDGIDIIETDPKTAAALNSAAGISIDLALSTLKDSDGKLRLEIPVKGDIDKPDFRMQNIINKALGKAMQGATLGYLKHTLQPFGSLITLYQLAKTASRRVALPSVTFQTGSIQPAEGQRQLLEKITTLMKERPGLKIKACGLAVDSDRSALLAQSPAVPSETGKKPATPPPSEAQIRQQLFELAEQRAGWVKQQLVEAGISPERVLNCLGQIDTADSSLQPSVQLLL